MKLSTLIKQAQLAMEHNGDIEVIASLETKGTPDERTIETTETFQCQWAPDKPWYFNLILGK